MIKLTDAINKNKIYINPYLIACIKESGEYTLIITSDITHCYVQESIEYVAALISAKVDKRSIQLGTL